jgi:AraC family transcriptional regulator
MPWDARVVFPGLAAFCWILLQADRSGVARGRVVCDDARVMQRPTEVGKKPRAGAASRHELIARMGAEVVRFQDESAAFDDVAARVLALDRSDLPCLTRLLFGGPASVEELATALHLGRSATVAVIGRLQLAGYARRRPEAAPSRVELTEHARQWIERIWAPLREEGGRLLASYPTRELAAMRRFMVRARDVQERQVRILRTWLALPASAPAGTMGARTPHLRGGLSPAALRRVQLFVEANLQQTIHLADLAGRAGLSLHHFARAFRTSAGITPRAFIEQRRIARARQLIDESRQSLAEIALETGFGTQSRLTTTFRRHTGFTPSAYRRGRQS